MKKTDKPVTISVITATYNAAAHLPKLIESLRAQTDKDFEWVVADGSSSDGTLGLLKDAADISITVSSQPDFGIYDALNRAIKISKGEYYLVVGSDDFLFPNAIEDYRKAIQESGADIVTATVMAQERQLKPKKGKAWLYGSRAFVSAHSVGSLFRKSLHTKFGYYSKMFPVSAEDLFTQKACRNGASCYNARFIAGEFTTAGLSNTDIIAALTDGFRVQLLMEKKFPQLIIFLLRLIKNYRRLK